MVLTRHTTLGKENRKLGSKFLSVFSTRLHQAIMRQERERTVIYETVNKRGTKEKLQNNGKNGNKYEGDTEKRERG